MPTLTKFGENLPCESKIRGKTWKNLLNESYNAYIDVTPDFCPISAIFQLFRTKRGLWVNMVLKSWPNCKLSE